MELQVCRIAVNFYIYLVLRQTFLIVLVVFQLISLEFVHKELYNLK